MTDRQQRLAGIDFARGIAICGMFALHAIPLAAVDTVSLSLLTVFGDQRTQILFAILDGIALAMLSSGTSAGVRSYERRSIAVRGLFLVALGLFLTTLQSGVIGILDYYGVYFLLVLPLLYLRARWLLGLSAGLFAIGPAITDFARSRLGDPSLHAYHQPESLPPLFDRITSWLLVGQYPACVWLAYVILGLAIFRLGLLVRARQMVIMLASGTIGLITLLTGQAIGARDSVCAATVLWASSAAWCVLLIAASLLLLDTRSTVALIATHIVRPVSLMGSMPVTMYAFHVIYFAYLAWSAGIASIQGWPTFLTITLGGVLFAVTWSQVSYRGPLETVVRYFMPRSPNSHIGLARQPWENKSA